MVYPSRLPITNIIWDDNANNVIFTPSPLDCFYLYVHFQPFFRPLRISNHSKRSNWRESDESNAHPATGKIIYLACKQRIEPNGTRNRFYRFELVFHHGTSCVFPRIMTSVSSYETRYFKNNCHYMVLVGLI